MSWKNVKTLLILLLVAVNTVLAVFAFTYFKDANFTSKDTAVSAAEILAKSGIEVSPELLSVKNDAVDILSCEYTRETYLSLVASFLFGKEADGIYLLPNGIQAETLEGESILLGYDMSISFTAEALDESIYDALHKATKTDPELAKGARKSLETLIAMPSGSLENAVCKSYGDYVFITVEQQENKLPIYNMSCVFGLKNEKIVYASGKHFFGVPETKESEQLLDRVNILFSEKERGMQGTVTDISLCYTLYEDASNNRMLLIPSYLVTYADRSSNAVNAINKEKYQLP